MPDPYVLPGTAILRNKFNLTTQQDLDDAEADFASLRLRELAGIMQEYGIPAVAGSNDIIDTGED